MITDKERHVIVHALTGGNDRGVYRNFYAADVWHHSAAEIKSLVDKGFMSVGHVIGNGADNYRYYHVTQTGADAVGLKLEGVEE